jgi:AcrR family transcriptional regulator
MQAEPGLRERKKQQTRQLIADTAMRLFGERGFEAVTVAEVARAANVSEGTVFNYFPTKESLVYDGMERFEAKLVDAVRSRPPGEPVLAAFGRFLTERTSTLGFANVDQTIVTGTRVIAASPELLAREREIIDGYTRSLAAVIAAETGAWPGDIEPWVVANALMGVHRAAVEAVQRGALDGRSGPDLAAEVRSQAERALALLAHGFDDYAARK